VTAPGLMFVLAAAAGAAPTSQESASVARATLSKQLERLQGVLPVAAHEALVAASDAELDEFQTDDMFARVLGGGALRRSRLGRELAHRGIDRARDLSWLVLAAYRRRGRSEPLDLDVLVADTVAHRESLQRQKQEIVARQRAAGIKVYSDAIQILDQISFAGNQATVSDDASAVLDAIAHVLQDNPQLALFDCRGHADRGERNPVMLGQRRAEAVRAQLIARGVAPARLTVTSAGADPLPPDSPPHAAGNRRVDFAILRCSTDPGWIPSIR